MIDLECIVVVGVLIGPSLTHQMVHVDSRNDVDVIVTYVRMRGASHVISLRMPFEFREHGLWVLFFDGGNIFHIPKEQVLDMMRHIKSLDDIIYPQSRVNVLICMATDMKIPWDFLNSKVTLELTPVSFLECLLSHLELSLLIWFFKQLEAFSIIYRLAISIQPIFLYGSKIGRMRHHGILYIQRDDLARKPRQYNIQMYPTLSYGLLHLSSCH